MDYNKKSIAILYHFFYPDNVISSRHFTQLAEGLVNKGWDVTVFTSNRFCRDYNKKIELKEEKFNGINIIRISRPKLNQSNPILRLINSLWVSISWYKKLNKLKPFDILLIGTDPQFSPIIIPFLKRRKVAKKYVHWCFDLYPEAIIIDYKNNPIVKLFSFLMKIPMKWAYKNLDLFVDLGPCMKKRISDYNLNIKQESLVPWALAEPDIFKKTDLIKQEQIYGKSDLVLLYSGNLGKAHDFELFVSLARKLRAHNVKVFFASSGNRLNKLKQYINKEDINIFLLPMVEEKDLEIRLNSADIHLISLKKEWDGIVIPSKFFGSLAVGKPVIFAGTNNSSINMWIKEYNLGYTLNENNLDEIYNKIIELKKNKKILNSISLNSFTTYKENFSKELIINKWDIILKDLLKQ